MITLVVNTSGGTLLIVTAPLSAGISRECCIWIASPDSRVLGGEMVHWVRGSWQGPGHDHKVRKYEDALMCSTQL